VIGNLFIVEFLGEFLSCHLSHFLSFHTCLGSCFLVYCMACLFFLAVVSDYEVVIQSLLLFYIKNIKIFYFLHFTYGICTFGYVALILTYSERLHFIEIVDITL
jgi:hypothetical protein